MTPIVMSFVCLNGDYSINGGACFGEVFVRQGTPDNPGKGAVAFIGNGEHWSHTRYNDAMAISVFERMVDENITDLGSLLNAGKMRFMDYFPNEIYVADRPFGHEEESVEFYFHIYNLMGDPSMKFWRQLPEEIQVSHAGSLPAGANSISVSVMKSNGTEPVARARVGIVQNGVLIGSGFTEADGSANLTLTTVTSGSDISITVSEAGVVPYEGTATTGTAAVFLSATSLSVDDASGNDDQVVNPGESLALTATMRNNGSSASSSFDLAIANVNGPASATGGQVTFPGLAGGSEGTATASLGLTIDENAADGSLITLQMDAIRTGGQHDYSDATLTVMAPAWEVISFADGQGSAPVAGETTDLVLTLRNTGSVPSAGGTVELNLLTVDGASLGTTNASLPACSINETVSTDAVFDLDIAAATATATNLTFELIVETNAGYVTETNCAVVVGPVDVSAPVGPDNYGYFAYDSADYDYPASRPQYVWNEISSEMGGPGTKLDFPVENEVVWMVVDLPFPFQYYGETYTEIRVSDNGWISFDTGYDYDFYNWTIPTQYGVEALVAPFWDNLNPAPSHNVNGIAPDGIYTYSDVGTGTFTVEWSRLPHYKPEILGFQTFQLVLLNPDDYPTTSGDGEMLFLYRQVNNNDHLRMYATVGIESPDGNDGLQLSFGNVNAPAMAPLQPGLAVRVTTESPIRVPFATTMTATDANGEVTLEWQTADSRPVVGWHVDIISNGQRQRLTSSALPADSHSFTTTSGNNETDARYMLTAMHPYGVTSEPGETAITATGALRLALYPAHPNPAHGSTTIGFSLPRESNVRLRVYDVAGRLVRTLVDGRVGSGEGIKIWDGRHEGGGQAAGGVYFYRLETDAQTLTRKMILVR